MTSGGEHPSDTASVLRAYFRDLDAATSRLPRGRREQLRSEIRQHVDGLLAELPAQSPADLRNLLDRVGLPEDIAAAALEEEPEDRRPPMRTSRKVLLGVFAVIVVAGLATGLAVALSSTGSSRSPAAHHTTSPGFAQATAAVSPGRGKGASTSPGSGTSALRTILVPAAVPPVSNECTVQVTYDADGNVSPLLCPSGGVNSVAWHVYAYGQNGITPLNSELLTLGQYASPPQVLQAMCYDLTNVYKTMPLTEAAEQLAQAYYGWRFTGDNPVSEFEQQGCPTS